MVVITRFALKKGRRSKRHLTKSVDITKRFDLLLQYLRTVPTVTAHTLCASRDTRVSYGWCLLIQEYFWAV